MPDTIIVQLNGNPEDAYSWLRLNEKREVRMPATTSTLDELSQQVQGATVVALLPPEEVLLLAIKLPVVKKNKLLHAIPFAIQEALSENVHNYHFTLLGEQEPSGIIHLAIIEKNRLSYWHQLLLDHHIEVHYLIPTLLVASFQQDSIEIMTHGNTCLVRSGEYAGFVTDEDNMPILLEAHLTEIEKPKKIILRQYGPSKSRERSYDHLSIPVELQQLPESQYFTDLAQNALNKLRYNLLWGKLLSRSKNQTTKQHWKISVGLLIAIIVIAFVNKLIQYGVYSSQNAVLLKKISAVYTQNFPNSTDVVAPKLRLEDTLKHVNGMANGNPYLSLLGTSGQVLKDTSILKINTVQFSNDTLSLQVIAQNFTDLDAVIKQLEAKGLYVTQNNAHSQGDTVSTTLLIKEST